MDSTRVEELLAQRAGRLQGRLGSPEFQGRVLGALQAERARSPRLRLLLGLGALASAAALLLAFLWSGPGTVRRAGLAVQVALLDGSGRELSEDSGVRGGEEPLPPPDEVHLELLAEAHGFARVFLYDAAGRLREPTAGREARLLPNSAVLLTFDLRGASAQPGELTWLIATAAESFAAEELGLPPALSAPAGPERRLELEALAQRSAADSGCEVRLRFLE